MSPKPYLVNGSTTMVAGAIGVYNEILQKKVQNHEMQWNPFMGQGSDFAAGAVYTALILMYYNYLNQRKPVKLSDWTAPFAAIALCTFGEFTGIMGDTFDPKDIAAYGIGAGIAYVIHRAFAANTLEGKISTQDI